MRRLWLRIAATTVGALVAAALVIAVMVAAIVWPWSGRSAASLSEIVAPQRTAETRVCPGPLQELGANPSAPTRAPSFGNAQQRTTDGVTTAPLAAPDNPSVSRDGAPQAVSSRGAAGALAAMLSQSAGSTTVRGLAAMSCVAPAATSWLVGGSTAPGRTTLLELANPSTVAARVTLTIWTEGGMLTDPPPQAVTVAPGTQRSVSLAGLAVKSQTPVIRVDSVGAPVAAMLQQTNIDTLTPAGVDWIAPTQPPSRSLVIPGVQLPSGADVDQSEDHLSGDAYSVVRFINPTANAVTARVTVTPEGKADATGSTISIALTPNQAYDMPIGKFSAGTYSVRITATGGDITAAVRTVLTTPAAKSGDPDVQRDFAWYPAAAPMADAQAIAIPPGPTPTLHLVNPASTPITVSVAVDGQPAQSVLVPTNGAAVAVAVPGAQVRLSDSGRLYGSVSFGDTDVLASALVVPPEGANAPIRIYPE